VGAGPQEQRLEVPDMTTPDITPLRHLARVRVRGARQWGKAARRRIDDARGRPSRTDRAAEALVDVGERTAQLAHGAAQLARRAGEALPAGPRTGQQAARTAAPAAVAGAAAGAMFLLDPHRGRARRQLARDRGGKLLRRGWRLARAQAAASQLDDLTLTRKVESEVFRDSSLPKEQVSVNTEDGVVYLRGQLSSAAKIELLSARVLTVFGVRGVKSLLHTPGTPIPAREHVPLLSADRAD
jgi:osmotically-inducible protein OsmY